MADCHRSWKYEENEWLWQNKSKGIGNWLYHMDYSFFITCLLNKYVNGLAQYIGHYFLPSICFLSDGISVYKFKGNFLNKENSKERGYYILKTRMYGCLVCGSISFCCMVVGLIRYLIHLLWCKILLYILSIFMATKLLASLDTSSYWQNSHKYEVICIKIATYSYDAIAKLKSGYSAIKAISDGVI